MQISDAQNQVAGVYVDLVASALGKGRAVHPETAIATSARLAGSLLLRSFDLKIDNAEPGTVVLSHEANEQGPMLLNILGGMLEHFGTPLNAAWLRAHPTQKGSDPELTVVQSLSLLQDEALDAASKSGLTLFEAAQAGAIATAFIVKECAKDIGGEIGFNAAAYGFIEGAKTVPPSLGSKFAGRSKPWYRFW